MNRWREAETDREFMARMDKTSIALAVFVAFILSGALVLFVAGLLSGGLSCGV